MAPMYMKLVLFLREMFSSWYFYNRSCFNLSTVFWIIKINNVIITKNVYSNIVLSSQHRLVFIMHYFVQLRYYYSIVVLVVIVTRNIYKVVDYLHWRGTLSFLSHTTWIPSVDYPTWRTENLVKWLQKTYLFCRQNG